MDDDFGIFMAFVVAWLIVVFFVIIPLAIVSHDSQPYCPVGQGTILDANSNVTGCVIINPQPVPVLTPGQVVPPMIGDR